MTTGRTPNLDLALPVQGELSGSWGDEVNNGITDYIDIAVAGTLTLTGDGAVTLANTLGAAAGDNIGSTTAQYAILKVVGPLTATKVITGPSSSKTYIVNNTDSTYGVTIKASGQTGVTVAAGQRALVVFNGTDYVSVSTSSGTGDVVGPASATDNAVVRFDGATGKLVQNSAVTIADTTGNITGGTYNKVTITAPATSATLTIADGKTLTANNSITFAGTDATTMTFPSASSSVGYLNIPAVADKTAAYTLATGDIGKVVGVGTGGSIEIPNSTFAAGDAVLIFNNTSAGITITCTITTAYIAGTDTDKASVTLATRGVANILFISSTACVITGNVT